MKVLNTIKSFLPATSVASITKSFEKMNEKLNKLMLKLDRDIDGYNDAIDKLEALVDARQKERAKAVAVSRNINKLIGG